jgi:hypothetical protein
MHEHVGIVAVLLILALAGNLGERKTPCCEPVVKLGPAVLVFP